MDCSRPAFTYGCYICFLLWINKRRSLLTAFAVARLPFRQEASSGAHGPAVQQLPPVQERSSRGRCTYNNRWSRWSSGESPSAGAAGRRQYNTKGSQLSGLIMPTQHSTLSYIIVHQRFSIRSTSRAGGVGSGTRTQEQKKDDSSVAVRKAPSEVPSDEQRIQEAVKLQAPCFNTKGLRSSKYLRLCPATGAG